MTIEELEKGFELHERRMDRIERNFELHERRMTQLGINLARLEQDLAGVKDNLVVQGTLLGRIEIIVERNTEAIQLNTEAIERVARAMQDFLKGLGGRNGNPPEQANEA